MGDTDRKPDDAPSPPGEPGEVRPDLEPHRGGRLLLLARVSVVCGALSFVLCFPAAVGFLLGLVAAAEAGHDLARMRAGSLDPSGRGLTDRAYSWGRWGLMLNVVGPCVGLAFWLHELQALGRLPF